MTVATLLLLLLGQQSPVATDAKDATAADGCLPGQEGFLSMRLRGSIEAEIHWQEPALACTGMSRPDGRGFRIRFAGPLATGGELAIVFAAPELGRGVSARAVPVNVTLLDDAGKRIYGTQGDSRCAFDEVEQRAIDDSSFPAHSYRVSASGFCVAPARAVDGDGSVLLTRFDFAGLVTFREDEGAAAQDQNPPDLFPDLEKSGVDIVTATGVHRFAVWIAADHRSQVRGLMNVRELPPAHGMLFLFEPLRPASFWMKDTYLPLDIIFIRSDGVVVNIAHDAQPLSLEPIRSLEPIAGAIELAGGTARRIGLEPGDKVVHPALGNQESAVIVAPKQHPSVARTPQKGEF